jgi:uncharacterized membrane protein YbaN (DUF454 family)
MTGSIVRQAGDCLVVADSRAFHPEWRRFIDRLVDGLLERLEVKAVRVDLSTATCQVRFEPGADRPAQMAAVFRECLRDAGGTQPGWLQRLATSQRPWTTQMAERHERGTVVLLAIDDRPGQICIRARSSPKRRRRLDELLDELGRQPGIHALRVRGWPEGLDIDYDPARLNKEDILTTAMSAWALAEAGHSVEPTAKSNRASPRSREFMDRGPRRLLYLALGCGSLGMSFVGLVVPGIPTVPFLLASSYYLARSSRPLHRWLLESRLFGQILREWETHRALSPQSKWGLAAITLVVLLVTVTFVPSTPVILVLVAVMMSLTLLGLYRIPAIDPAAKPIPALGI